MRYSRVVLAALLASFAAAGCGKDKKSSGPVAPEAQAAIDTLTVFADSSVTGEPRSGVKTLPRGERVSYRYEPAGGFKNAVVVLDSAVAALAGSLTMNGNRRILASAEKVVMVPPEAQPLQMSVAKIFTAPDTAAVLEAYIEHTKELDALYAAYGPEQARELAYAAYLAAYDAADERSVEAAERALEGHLFGGAGERISSSLAAASTVSLVGPNTSLIFVNGILNSTDKAAASRKELELAVADAGLASEVEVYNFYNASALYDQNELRKCLGRAVQRASGLAILVCKGASVISDFTEARRQIAEIFNQLPAGAEPTAKVLARIVRQERGNGRAVILMGHSQGTLVIQQALKEMGEYDQCVAALSLAGPLGKESWQMWSESNYNGFVVAGERAKDIILALGHNDFLQIATSISSSADQYLAQRENPYTTGVTLMVAERLRQDLRLHNMVTSYMAGKESRELVKTTIASQVSRLSANPDCRIPSGSRIYASSGQVIGGRSYAPSDLWIVSPYTNGTDTLVGRIRTADGFKPVITDLALSPDGELWGVSFDRLYHIDKKTGLASGSWSLDLKGMNALTFDPVGLMYIADNRGFISRVEFQGGLPRIRSTFGRFSPLLFLVSSGDLAFSPGGILYASVAQLSGPAYLATVDLETGRATLVSSSPIISFSDIWGLAFVGNVLFGLTTDVTSSRGELITINTETGVGTAVRPLAFNAFGAAAKPAGL